MSVLNGLRSWLDIAWVRMTTASSSGSKFFGREGWGDMEAQDALWAKIKADGVDGFPDIDDVVETEAGRRTVVLTFPSPCKEFLPPVCHEVRVHVIEPKDRGRPGEPVKHAGVVIVLGHLYEHSLAHRVKVTRRLVKRGFVVVLPIMPYYMERAPLLQRKSYFSSVADLLTGAGAGAVEQAKLVQLLAKRYPDVPLGISGTSYGSVIGLAAATLLEHEKIAISAVAPPAGPATLLNGAMRNKISFRKLGEPGPKKRKEAKAELRRVLNSRGLDDFLRGHPECAIHSMYLIFGRADRIAPSKEDYSIWGLASRLTVNAKAERRNASHVTIALGETGHLTRAVTRSFKLLDAAEARKLWNKRQISVFWRKRAKNFDPDPSPEEVAPLVKDAADPDPASA